MKIYEDIQSQPGLYINTMNLHALSEFVLTMFTNTYTNTRERRERMQKAFIYMLGFARKYLVSNGKYQRQPQEYKRKILNSAGICYAPTVKVLADHGIFSFFGQTPSLKKRE